MMSDWIKVVITVTNITVVIVKVVLFQLVSSDKKAVLNSFDQILSQHCVDHFKKKAIPQCIAICSVSNPSKMSDK